MRRLLLVLVACMIVSTTAIWPFQLNPTTDRRQGQTDDHRQPTHLPVVNVTGGHAQPDSPEITAKNEPKPVKVTEMPSPDWWYRTYIIATLALVVFGGLGVRYAIRTLKAIEMQGRTMEGQLATMKEQSAAIAKSAEAAKQSADVLINTERAWLHAEVETSTEQRLMTPSAYADHTVTIMNYGRTVGEITGYRAVPGTIESIDQVLERGQTIAAGEDGRRFLAPGQRQAGLYRFNVKQLFENLGIWNDIGRNTENGVIIIEIRYCDVLDRKTVRSSRFVYRYDSDVLRLNILPEYTEYS